MTKEIIVKHIIDVRFSEVDSLRIVWHGHYLKYLEEGREAFGKHYGISYLDVLKKGYVTPLVDIRCEYKKSLAYGDRVIIETVFDDCDAAKIKFKYNIYRESDNELVTTAESTQVFLDINGDLMLTIPDFFIEWKKKYL